MVSITIHEKFHLKKLDRFLMEHFKQLPHSAIYKAIRKKDIKVNDIRINQNVVLQARDRLDIYIKDEILYGCPNSSKNAGNKISLDVVYEDNQILLINKNPGIPTEPNSASNETSLIELAKSYLLEKGEYAPKKSRSFAPALCHRLDRNTGGIVIIAKTPESLEIMLDKIKNREVKKYYQCIVIGCPSPVHAELKHYLFKDQQKSHVYISDTRKSGSVEVITRYKVLSAGKEMSKLEVELVTGKTHQIRAHLAYIGHPIVGDGKYGINQFNRKFGAKYQALWAYKVVFDFKDGGVLNYLCGKVIETDDIGFGIKIT